MNQVVQASQRAQFVKRSYVKARGLTRMAPPASRAECFDAGTDPRDGVTEEELSIDEW